MTKTITMGLVALAFVAGSIMTGTMADAASKTQGQPFQQFDTEIVALSLQVDSFFDVFFDVDDDGTRNTFDAFFEVDTGIFGDPDFLFGDPDFAIDSFFDVFTELDARDRHFDTEIVSMQLRGGSPLTVSNIGSSGEDGVQIALPKGSLQSQIDRLELRIAELEGDSKTCEECKLDLREALSACVEGDDACVTAANLNYRECLSGLSSEELDLCTKVLPPTRK
jgi:hypothetical protein